MKNTLLGSCPQKKTEIVDQYFMEHRAKLIDIAAYLDRLDRGVGDIRQDYRQLAFLRALEILSSDQPLRAKRVLELFSDHSNEIPQSAEGTKGASGAVPFSTEEQR